MAVNTWKEQFVYKETFYQRLELMLSKIDFENINSVIDLGCGNQWAKNIVPKNVKYIPVDFYKHCNNTITLDFNRGEYYDDYVDLAICSGIFEYIYDLKSFIEKMARYSNYVVCSYHFKDYKTYHSKIWVNDYDAESFIKIFQKNGFELEIPIIHIDMHKGESLCYFKRIGIENFVKEV